MRGIDLHTLLGIIDIGIRESPAARRVGWRERGRNIRQLLIDQIDKLADGHVGQSTQRQGRSYGYGNTAQVEIQNAGVDIRKSAAGQCASRAAGGPDRGSLAELVISGRAVPINTGATADDPFLI